MIFAAPPPEDLSRAPLRAALGAGEGDVVERLLDTIDIPAPTHARIAAEARKLVERVRAKRGEAGLDSFLQEFSLSSREGVVLMCLAEALLRIPDSETADRLIHDKLGPADWERHLGHSHSLFVNASTWALMLTGRIVRLDDEEEIGRSHV